MRGASVPTARPRGPGDVGRREPGSDAVGVERACATAGDALVCAAATSVERRLSDWPDRRRACRCRSVDREGNFMRGFRVTIEKRQKKRTRDTSKVVTKIRKVFFRSDDEFRAPTESRIG